MHISPATTLNLDDIATILQEVWGEELIYPIGQHYIEDAQCALWVGTDTQGAVGGFVSAFIAQTASARIWNIDMLAVRPQRRGQGLGRALIQAALSAAFPLGLTQSRALVRVENTASQRCFSAAGFSSEHVSRHMMTWPAQDAAPTDYPTEMHLLPVDALAYRGLWIEELENTEHSAQRHALAYARTLCTREERSYASALIPVEHINTLASDLRSTAQMHGIYAWWQRSIDADDQQPVLQ